MRSIQYTAYVGKRDRCKSVRTNVCQVYIQIKQSACMRDGVGSEIDKIRNIHLHPDILNTHPRHPSLLRSFPLFLLTTTTPVPRPDPHSMMERIFLLTMELLIASQKGSRIVHRPCVDREDVEGRSMDHVSTMQIGRVKGRMCGAVYAFWLPW